MKLAQELIRFGQFADENAAAHDLWSWLPSQFQPARRKQRRETNPNRPS